MITTGQKTAVLVAWKKKGFTRMREEREMRLNFYGSDLIR
jgi:hypothetical protein